MTSTTIVTAARLLRENAAELKQSHTIGGLGEWDACEAEVKAAHDELISAAQALESLPSQCLHQIQEPAAAAVPAAVPVPDERAAFEKWWREWGLGGIDVQWEAWQARAALAATPAAPEMVLDGGAEISKKSDETQQPCGLHRGGEVVLPPPDLWRDAEGLRGYAADPGPGPWYTADTVRALLAGVAAPAAVADIADLVTGMSVSVDVSTGDDDAGNRYFGTVTVAQEDAHEKHGLTLLVQDAKPNFAPQAQADARDAERWAHFAAVGVFPKKVFNNGNTFWQYGQIKALSADSVADAAIAAAKGEDQ